MKAPNTFTFETVLSDERKIEFIKEAIARGFKIYLYFVCTSNPEINKFRVAVRVKKKGHYVPDDKVESRYYNSLKLLPVLVPLSHRCFLFDNSDEGPEDKLNLVAEVKEGHSLTIHSATVPWWVEEYVINKLFEGY